MKSSKMHIAVRSPQTKSDSLLESITDTLIGFIISYLLLRYAVPYIWGIPITQEHSFQIVILFTIVAVARKYFTRRTFNRFVDKFYYGE